MTAKLEDLLLEGDSLEVSLDETAHIGRIVQVLNTINRILIGWFQQCLCYRL